MLNLNLRVVRYVEFEFSVFCELFLEIEKMLPTVQYLSAEKPVILFGRSDKFV